MRELLEAIHKQGFSFQERHNNVFTFLKHLGEGQKIDLSQERRRLRPHFLDYNLRSGNLLKTEVAEAELVKKIGKREQWKKRVVKLALEISKSEASEAMKIISECVSSRAI